MNELDNICPKCQTARTELKGDLVYCPNCDFEGEEKKPDVSAQTCGSQIIFWFALLMPATLGLLSYLLGQVSDNLRSFGIVVGAVGMIIGTVSSIYCGVWLARRFYGPGGLRILAGFLFVVGIGFVNLAIVINGCVRDMKF